MSLSLSSLLLPLLLLAAGAVAQHDPNFCAITIKGRARLPPAPNVFFMTVRKRISGDADIVTSLEYYNGDLDKSAFYLGVRENGYRAVVDYKEKQVIVVDRSNPKYPGNCQVKSNVENDELLVGIELIPGFPVKLSVPSKFLYFGDGPEGIDDQGEAEIDGGLKVRKFYSCYYLRSMDTSMKITWYYLGYDTADVAPYRIEMEMLDNSNKEVRQAVLDISNFRNYAPRWTATTNPFMAPPGVYCMGMASRRPVPRLPERFSIRTEELKTNSTQPISMMEAYDLSAGMSQLEILPPAGDERPRFGRGKILFMRDFLSETQSYIINLDQGNCTFAPIRGDDWDARHSMGRIRVRSPREFFDLDWDYIQFKGSGFVRGIPADVFVGFKQVDSQSGKINMTKEWYLIEKMVWNVSTGAPMKVSVPIAIKTSSGDQNNLNAWSYFYDFETVDLRFNRHEIGQCFNNDQKRHFVIYFPLPDEQSKRMVEQYPRDFMMVTVPLLAAGIGISQLRVIDPEVIVSSTRNTALLEVTVTDRPTGSNSQVTIEQVDPLLREFVRSGTLGAVLPGLNRPLIATQARNIEKRLRELGSINVGYSAGDMAGAAVGLLLAGLVAGLVAAFFYFR